MRGDLDFSCGKALGKAVALEDLKRGKTTTKRKNWYPLVLLESGMLISWSRVNDGITGSRVSHVLLAMILWLIFTVIRIRL